MEKCEKTVQYLAIGHLMEIVKSNLFFLIAIQWCWWYYQLWQREYICIFSARNGKKKNITKWKPEYQWECVICRFICYSYVA